MPREGINNTGSSHQIPHNGIIAGLIIRIIIMRLATVLPFLFTGLLFLSSCGQTGPLYLPQEELPTEPAATTDEEKDAPATSEQ